MSSDKKPDLSHLSDVEKEIEEMLENSFFSPLDSAHIKISSSHFVEKNELRCSKAVQCFAEELMHVLREGKNAGLNPVIDEIYEHTKNGRSGIEAIVEHIEQNALFEIHELDKKQDVLKIRLFCDILVANMAPFLLSKNIKIMSASIQGALFKKEIG